MRRKKINITVQYALRYFLVIIATALFTFLLVGWILQKHKETVVNNVRDNVHAFMQELDLSLVKQQTVAQEIFSDELTAPGNIDSHPLQMVKGIKQLALYQNAIPLNDYLFLRYPETEELILHSGSYSLEGFMKYQLKLDEDSKEIMRSMMNNYAASESAILISSTGENIFIWSYPFRNGYNGKKGIVSFGITGSTLEGYLHDKVQDMPFYATLIDDAGQMLFEINELSDISETELTNIREQLFSEEDMSVKGYTFDVYDSVNGFAFGIVMDDSYILSDFRHIVSIVFVWGSIIFILVVILILFVNNIHINQIRKVRDGLLGLQKGDNESNSNEFVQIQNLIKNIYQEQSRKAEERNWLDSTMSELIAKLLFCGKLEQREDILRELVTMFCPDLHNKYYTVLGIISGERCEALVRKWASDTSCIVCQEEQETGGNLLYLIMGLEDADTDGRHRKEIGGKLLDAAHKQGIQNMFIAAGRIYGQLNEISKAYEEVLLLTNLLLSGGEVPVGKVFVYEMTQQTKPESSISIEEIL